MFKIENYIIEFHKCLYPIGYIIEISKKEELSINKEYLFCNLDNYKTFNDLRLYIMEHTKNVNLVNLLKNNSTINKFYDIIL